ncbi:hypothetical protein V6N13_071378 [Hibiscus sabdariffa]|uniref:Uncharacterized protein n=1 Tax=Hibiscus sabdariffa TaxID=183260 RepID=A0ABR2TDQ0_9ROSI
MESQEDSIDDNTLRNEGVLNSLQKNGLEQSAQGSLQDIVVADSIDVAETTKQDNGTGVQLIKLERIWVDNKQINFRVIDVSLFSNGIVDEEIGLIACFETSRERLNELVMDARDLVVSHTEILRAGKDPNADVNTEQLEESALDK